MNIAAYLILGGIILALVINFAISSNNIFKIVSYCLEQNSVSNYWTMFFKSSFSFRALISSTLGLIVALMIFLVITPYILIRTFSKKEPLISAAELSEPVKESYLNSEVQKTKEDPNRFMPK
ncbi:hypothetical protein NQT66_01580 [Cellulophaga baltica]|uniref:hypothetical protein n=1 Tax=Cellulophaga baltica TaxID=76594 RepID=UPI0021493B0D|nr:hypothetical protein [Cellulophaga baltica]MCR1023480.1 hypothetical protein [Cellulophaga baltica]